MSDIPAIHFGLRNDARQVMVCPADDLVVWGDFPRGLRVLLLDEDGPSSSETRLKLEAMDYIVISYYNENDALEAISKKTECFHVAIVEVTIGNIHGSFRFLEMAKDLPTVVMSNVRCLTTMMKCIALGAAEFLQKPLSEDKLGNIWQHVVHKALNTGANVLSKSLKPIKETVVSMLRLQSETIELKIEVPYEVENGEKDQENVCENSVAYERFSGPSTPQLVRGGRLLDDRDCHEQPNCSIVKVSTEKTKELLELGKHDCSGSKLVDNTCNNLTSVDEKETVSPYWAEEAAAEEEENSANGSKADECSAVKEGSLPSSQTQNGDHVESHSQDLKKKKSPLSIDSHGNKGKRKRTKVDWSPELHRRFVQVVEQLGIDQAIPSNILELMKVEGLTRHNIASHLQKFRMHRRHILPKYDERRWQMRIDSMPRGYTQKPLMAFPPHFNYGLPPNQVYPVWGHPSYLPSGVQMWGHAGFPAWSPPPESLLRNTYPAPANHADGWGCPIVHPYNQWSFASQSSMSNGLDVVRYRDRVLKDSYDLNPAEEVIDEVVKEAMSKPWLPLPLGLRPPSTDSVLAELNRQGIRTIPPPHSCTLLPPHCR